MDTRCSRCGGFIFLGLPLRHYGVVDASEGELGDSLAYRCLNCGDYRDLRVILNRMMHEARR
jgi:DNA-directed RNA polymerase subunit RPC12/RpoP